MSGRRQCASGCEHVDHDEQRETDQEAEDRGGEATDYDDRTVEELRDRAAELDIEGRSSMSKDELIDALRNH